MLLDTVIGQWIRNYILPLHFYLFTFAFPPSLEVKIRKVGTLGCLYTSPQSLSTIFSYSLDKQPWGLILDFDLLVLFS